MNIQDAFHDLVPFVQFKKHEKHLRRSVTLNVQMVPNRATYRIYMLQ